MARTGGLLIILLLGFAPLWIEQGLAAPVPATSNNASAPPGDSPPQAEPAAIEHTGDKSTSNATSQPTAEPISKPTSKPTSKSRASPPNVEFRPSEEISEDYPVAFPADI